MFSKIYLGHVLASHIVRLSFSSVVLYFSCHWSHRTFIQLVNICSHSTLQVYYLDVYAILDQGDTLSFVTLYNVVNFNVNLENHSEPFAISTPLGG